MEYLVTTHEVQVETPDISPRGPGQVTEVDRIVRREDPIVLE